MSLPGPRTARVRQIESLDRRRRARWRVECRHPRGFVVVVLRAKAADLLLLLQRNGYVVEMPPEVR